MNDLAFERKPPGPKVQHFFEVRESITHRQRVSLRGAEFHAINCDERITIAFVTTGVDLDLLDLYARHTHEELCALMTQPGVEMQYIARLVWIRPRRADSVRLLAG